MNDDKLIEIEKYKNELQKVKQNNLMLKHLVDMLKEEKYEASSTKIKVSEKKYIPNTLFDLYYNKNDNHVQVKDKFFKLCNEFQHLKLKHEELINKYNTQHIKHTTTQQHIQQEDKYKILSIELLEEVDDLRNELVLKEKGKKRDIKRLKLIIDEQQKQLYNIKKKYEIDKKKLNK